MYDPKLIHVLVEGRPGVGKSTLLQALAKRTSSNVVLWHGGGMRYRFSPRGRGLPKDYVAGTPRSIKVFLGLPEGGPDEVLLVVQHDHAGGGALNVRFKRPGWVTPVADVVCAAIEEVGRGE